MRGLYRLLLILVMLMPTILWGQYHDRQIPGIVETYFQRNRTAPTLLRVEVTEDAFYGRTLRVKIQGNRNTRDADLGFAFGAAAAIANYANDPIASIWVEMNLVYKEVETVIAVAPAPCSIDAIVRHSRTFEDWWDNCLELL